jgi:hypothetical protein
MAEEDGDEKGLHDWFAAAAIPRLAGAYRPGETSLRDLAEQRPGLPMPWPMRC